MNCAGGGSIETLIFLDIDGVLNIGVADPGHHPVMFDAANVARAFQMLSSGGADLDVADRVVATYQRELGEGDAATYAAMAAEKGTGFSDLLVARFAAVLRAAGPQRRVVLSSSWRKPSYAPKVRALEAAVARHLGEAFAFDAATEQFHEKGAGDRLHFIGRFITEHCESAKDQHPSTRASLRVLVLDDFFASRICTKVGGHAVNSPADAERYLAGLAPTDASVMVAHTYDEWSTPSGLQVKIGSGISKEHLDKIHAFLATGSAPCERPSPAKAVLPSKEPYRSSSALTRLGKRLALPVWSGGHSAAPSA